MSDVSTVLRARSYRLFAALVERGVTPDVRPVLADLPPLAEDLDEIGNPDEAAARHYRLFHHEVQPVASIFLERSGRVGGEVTRAAAASYGGEGAAGTGLPADHLVVASGLAADHLVVALRALAAFTDGGGPGGEGGSSDSGSDTGDERDDRTRILLESHLLWWLPIWSATVARLADPFWRDVVGLLVDAVLDHAVALPVAVERDPPFGLAAAVEGPFVGPDGPTGLNRVADYVATPARSGICLTPAELRRLSREAGAPAGFGDRRRVLRNLLRSAATYEVLPAVMEGVGEVLAQQRAWVHDRVPARLDGYVAPWRARWAILRGVLDQLSAAGGTGVRPDERTGRDE